MDGQFPVYAPLGRLYDPLLQLAHRLHRALAINEKTVWTDRNGHVFATPIKNQRTISPHATIGVYTKWTSLPEIEAGLRLALRERASAWIVDWKAPPSNVKCQEVGALQLMPPLRRRRRIKREMTASISTTAGDQPRP